MIAPGEIELLIDGQRYGGWKSVRITRGIEQLAGEFSLSVTERWPGMDVARPVRAGAKCAVTIDGEPVVTGYVDTVSPRYDETSHQVEVTGRDATGDLVDCSAIVGDGRVEGTTLAGMARLLARPFGVPVVVLGDAGSTDLPGEYAVQEGESVFETLERAAKYSGALLYSDGSGRLVVGNAGAGRAAVELVEGLNIRSASAEWSWRDRHSVITVKGQSSGDDFNFGDEAAQPSSEARDLVIDRHRPLVLLADGQTVTSTASNRAQWEVKVRRGRGTRARATVSGFYAGAALWTPNTLVPLVSPWLNANRDMLIARVTYLIDDKGRRTELELVAPEAYAPLGELKVKRRKTDSYPE